MSRDHVDLVRSAYQAYNRRDVQAVLRCFDPQIDWHVPDTLAWGGHVHGLDAMPAFFERLRPYVGADHHIVIDELIEAAGDRVVALVRHRGTTPDRQPYDVPAIMVWTVRGGRLCGLYEQMDTLSMVRATEGLTTAA